MLFRIHFCLDFIIYGQARDTGPKLVLQLTLPAPGPLFPMVYTKMFQRCKGSPALVGSLCLLGDLYHMNTLEVLDLFMYILL